MATDDPVMQKNKKRFMVFVREAPKGAVSLGASAGIIETSMYFAFAGVGE
jgi:hypothetical protein